LNNNLVRSVIDVQANDNQRQKHDEEIDAET